MQEALKIPCAQCLNPGDRVLYDEIMKLIRQHGFNCAALSQIDSRPRKGPKRGLCITCNKRDVCADAFQEGGVWHCLTYA